VHFKNEKVDFIWNATVELIFVMKLKVTGVKLKDTITGEFGCLLLMEFSSMSVIFGAPPELSKEPNIFPPPPGKIRYHR